MWPAIVCCTCRLQSLCQHTRLILTSKEQANVKSMTILKPEKTHIKQRCELLLHWLWTVFCAHQWSPRSENKRIRKEKYPKLFQLHYKIGYCYIPWLILSPAILHPIPIGLPVDLATDPLLSLACLLSSPLGLFVRDALTVRLRFMAAKATRGTCERMRSLGIVP